MEQVKPDVATEAEVAEALQMGKQSLATMRYQGVGPKFLKLGGAVRYRWSDVNAWLDENTRQSTRAGVA